MLQCTQNASWLRFDKKEETFGRYIYIIYKSHIIFICWSRTIILQQRYKEQKIEVGTTTKHDDMFITSYDIELEKANKDFDAST